MAIIINDENSIFYLYRHIRLDKNEPFYIGIGCQKNYQRAYVKKHRNKYWNNIVNSTDYRVEIILDNLTKDEALQKEKEFIALYGRKDLGLGTLVNMTDGGDGTFNPSIEARIKIGKGSENRIPWNKDFKNKISEETRLKMRNAKLGCFGSKNNAYNSKKSEENKKMKGICAPLRPLRTRDQFEMAEKRKPKRKPEETSSIRRRWSRSFEQ
jgi:hypothetical protein